MTDQWDRKTNFGCFTCMFYVPKVQHGTGDGRPEGRCRRNAPTMKGYPVVFDDDWCGEHKRGSNPVRDKEPTDNAFVKQQIERMQR